jgi:integrase
MVFLTYPQYQLIRSHAPASVRDMLDVAVGTGLRFAELTALQVGDIDILAKPHPSLRARRAWKKSGAVRSLSNRRSLDADRRQAITRDRNAR